MRSTEDREDVEHIAIAAALRYYLERTEIIQSNQEEDKEAGKRWLSPAVSPTRPLCRGKP